jgi:hypothetical protein
VGADLQTNRSPSSGGHPFNSWETESLGSMAAGPDLSNFSHAHKDALIASLMAQVAALTARLAELEAKLGLPAKTPDNSSVPSSKGQKKSEPATPKAKT